MDKETMEFLKEFREEINSEIKEFRKEINCEIKEFRKETNSQFKEVNQRLDEHTQLLRALEHSAEVSKAEHDKMANDIAHIEGNVEGLRKDLSNVEIVTASNWAEIARLKAVK